MNLEEKIEEQNEPILSVSEVSFALKSSIEQIFSSIQVQGEVSTIKRAASGHIYFSLKDEKSVLNAILWRTNAKEYDSFIQEGALVVLKGHLSTFPGRSNYQIIVHSVSLAGEGNLLKQLEELKEKLAKEGLFDESKKKPIPFLPKLIGVITSPSGAVIRDIMHRLDDRFPREVLLYPVLVQGVGAAEQITKAIEKFNAFPQTLPDGQILPRPDLLIVARGGGSLEDLWCFNDERVVRAVSQSSIPIISAVGHETDTMLIDYAADLRAPTPTGAAEKAVPVQDEILLSLEQRGLRLKESLTRFLEEKRLQILSVERGLPNLGDILHLSEQRLDDISERLTWGFKTLLQNKASSLELQSRLLETCSYKKVLERGFALASTKDGKVISSLKETPQKTPFILSFYDGKTFVQKTEGGQPPKKTPPKSKPKKELKNPNQQGNLFE